MKATPDVLYMLTFLISTLTAGLCFYNDYRSSAREYRYLSGFWASMALMPVIHFFTRDGFGAPLVLATIGWILPIILLVRFLEVVTDKGWGQKFHYLALGAGAFFSIALSTYGQSFMISSLPFTLGVAGFGGPILSDIWKNSRTSFFGPVFWLTLAFFGLLLILRVTWPFWGDNKDLVAYGFLADLLIIFGLAPLSFSLPLEVTKVKQKLEMDKMLKSRTEQLLGQSKYSELGMMSAGIAHEINNPLAIIQAKATQLLRIYRDADRSHDLADGLQQILYTSERIHKTIQGVREFVHQDDKMRDDEIELKDLINDVLSFCGQRMKNHGINLRFYGLEKYKVKGHKIQLEQVILNLLNNSFDAIEFLPDKWIELSVRETPISLQIYLKDSGSGVPTDVAEQMMEPFFTTKEVGKGTGLGLALAKGIVEKHGGKLEYVSGARHTTFMVELPRPGIPYIMGPQQEGKSLH